jgi:hypothetical protein
MTDPTDNGPIGPLRKRLGELESDGHEFADRLADAEHRIQLLQAQRDDLHRRVDSLSECFGSLISREHDKRLAALESRPTRFVPMSRTVRPEVQLVDDDDPAQQPAPVRWTKTPPDRAGWWWMRLLDGAEVVRVLPSDDGMRVHWTSGRRGSLRYMNAEWSSAPVEPPAESEES